MGSYWSFTRSENGEEIQKDFTFINRSFRYLQGDDHVFVCKRLADDTVVAERRINPGGYSRPELANTISNAGGTFTVLSQSLQDGKAYCRFTLSNLTRETRRRRAVDSLSQSTAYYPLIAIGILSSSSKFTFYE